jgi:hypothetical protein
MAEETYHKPDSPTWLHYEPETEVHESLIECFRLYLLAESNRLFEW